MVVTPSTAWLGSPWGDCSGGSAWYARKMYPLMSIT
jgi:hypothetical protein